MSAAQLNFSMLLHNFCRVRFQNWIGVVADITVNARQTVRRTVLVYQGASTREARHTVWRTVLVYHGSAPASGRPKPGKDTLAHMPEKSGMDTPCAPPLAGTAAGPAVCPQDGIAAAASSAAVTNVDRVFMMI